MANDEFRDQQQAARDAGLSARHETRVERAIRRQVAEEIAATIEGLEREDYRADEFYVGIYAAAAKAREIGSWEAS